MRNSVTRFPSYFNTAQDGILILNGDTGEITDVNQFLVEMLGFTPQELLGKKLWETGLLGDVVANQAAYQEFKEKGYIRYEDLLLQTKDGCQKNVEFISTVYRVDKHLAIQCIIYDITERKRAEEEWENSLSLLRATLESTTDGILVVDLKGKIVSFNHRFLEMWRIPDTVLATREDEQVLAFVLDQLKNPAEFLGKIQELYNQPAEESFEVLEFIDGRIFERYSRPQRISDQIIGRVWSFRDVTARARSEEALRESEDKYRSLFNSVPVGLYRTTPEGKFLDANLALVQMLGYPSQQALQSINVMDLYMNLEDHQAQRKLGENIDGSFEFEMQLRKHDGQAIWVRDIMQAIRDNSGRIQHYEGYLEDITKRRQVEDALTQEQQLMRSLMDNIPDGIYFKDTQSRFIRINQAQSIRLGLNDPGQASGKTDFDYFTEEHAQVAFEDEQKIIQTGQPLVGIEEKETWPDRKPNWVSTTKMPLRDEASNIIGTFGISRDITERKRAEAALQESEARYRRIIETAQEGIWIIDAESKTTFVNQRMAEMLDFTVEEMDGVPQFTFMDKENKAIAADYVERRRQGITEQYDFKFRRKDGVALWVIVSTTPLFDVKGDYAGALSMMTDITDRKHTEVELRHFSTHDALTGLYNRAFFEDEMVRLERGRQYPISIVMGDLDNLKATNDRDGHATGDELLRQAAQMLCDAFRKDDILARIGGDEFALLLPNSGEEAAKTAVNRIRKKVKIYNDTHKGTPLSLSLGTSTAKKGHSLTESLKQADEEMYLEKQIKRNLTTK